MRRRCPQCDIEKDADEFYDEARACKECKRGMSRQRYLAKRQLVGAARRSAAARENGKKGTAVRWAGHESLSHEKRLRRRREHGARRRRNAGVAPRRPAEPREERTQGGLVN